MGRTTVHAPAALLDAAAALYAGGGARAVTMVAVARAVGAPSGSLYHRFADRGALLAALWQRVARDHERGYHAVLGPRPTPDSAVRAAVWITGWSRDEPDRAAVLCAGRSAFEPATWPPEQRRADERAEQDRDRVLAAAVRAVAEQAGVPRDEAAFAMVGLPVAVVGSHLRARRPVPASAADLVERVARRLLTP